MYSWIVVLTIRDQSVLAVLRQLVGLLRLPPLQGHLRRRRPVVPVLREVNAVLAHQLPPARLRRGLPRGSTSARRGLRRGRGRLRTGPGAARTRLGGLRAADARDARGGGRHPRAAADTAGPARNRRPVHNGLPRVRPALCLVALLARHAQPSPVPLRPVPRQQVTICQTVPPHTPHNKTTPPEITSPRGCKIIVTARHVYRRPVLSGRPVLQ
jgi:hypothetical protein